MRRLMIAVAAGGLLLGVAAPMRARAEALPTTQERSMRARVDRVLRVEGRVNPDTGGVTRRQTLALTVLDGPDAGRTVETDYDLLALDAGDVMYLRLMVFPDGTEVFAIEEPDRRWALAALAAFFAVVVVLFGRGQGIRALVSLAGSVAIIIFVLLPRLLAGGSPLLLAFLIATGILAAAIAFTHGINRSSLAAFAGTIVAIAVTIALAEFAVRFVQLTGFAEDVAFYLDVSTGGRINLRGLLLAGMIIGVLGVLDDVAITQAATVEEIASAAPELSRREVYRRALRVGREHVSALVNTLTLAYAGAALPLLLLFTAVRDATASRVLNREVIAVEIVRTVVGSIGIILCVPVTTAIAVWLLRREPPAVRTTP